VPSPPISRRENARDRDVTRQSLMKDTALSSYAHNVKVIAHDGRVTLKGPVRSDDERRTVEAKATEVAGAGHVTNELSVAPVGSKRSKGWRPAVQHSRSRVLERAGQDSTVDSWLLTTELVVHLSDDVVAFAGGFLQPISIRKGDPTALHVEHSGLFECRNQQARRGAVRAQ
jgi:BON domain